MVDRTTNAISSDMMRCSWPWNKSKEKENTHG